MCHVMQRKVIMSLVLALHTLLTPPQHFHAICAICLPNWAPSTVPVNIWLAALRLSSGLSLWISMCSSSTSRSPPIVYFISFPSFILSSQIPSISLESSDDAEGGGHWLISWWLSQRVWGTGITALAHDELPAPAHQGEWWQRLSICRSGGGASMWNDSKS